MSKRLFTWDFFVGIFIGMLIGVVLATFLYMKNIDLANIRQDQKYLIQEVKELTKERQEINYIFKERGLIEDWNEQAIVKPETK